MSSSSSSLLETSSAHFGVIDWLLSAVIMGLTLAAGVYHGCAAAPVAKGGNGGTKSEPISGIRRKNVGSDLAVALVGFTSIGMAMGLPSEVYYRGATPVLAGALPAAAAALLVAIFVFLPVFSAQESPCVNPIQYLQLRFQSTFLVFLVRLLLCLSWVLVSGSLMNGLAGILCQISSLGTLKSALVVLIVAPVFVGIEGKMNLLWSDAVLSFAVLGSLMIATTVALADHGGLGGVIQTANARSLAVNNQDSAVIVFLGHFVMWLCLFIGFYTTDSRYARLQRKSSNLLLVTLNLPLLLLVFLLLTVTGAVLASAFGALSAAPCEDEQQQQWPDRVVAKLVIERLGSFHGFVGFPGFFLASMFAQTLSILSTGSNYLSGLIFLGITEDSIPPYVPEGGPATAASAAVGRGVFSRHVFPRCLAAAGTLCGGLLFVLVGGLRQETVLAAAMSTTSIIAGVVLAVFSLGLFFPLASGKGVAAAALLTLLLGHWVCIGRTAVNVGPLAIAARQYCGDGNGGNNSFDDEKVARFDSPHLPTGIQTAGRVSEKIPPGFLVPQRPDYHAQKTDQQQKELTEEMFLPRSPLYYQGSSLKQDPLLLSALASTGSNAAPSSPHVPPPLPQQNMPQLPANKNSNKMTPVLSSGSPNVYFPPSSPGIMNKPPLVLAKPEEAPQIPADEDQNPRGQDRNNRRGTTAAIYELSYHLYGIVSFLTTVSLGLLFSLRCPVRGGTATAAGGKINLTTTLDPRLIHPVARKICCKCCTNRIAKPENAIRISMKKRQSQMQSEGIEGSVSIAVADHALSRHCSHHSHVSKRSSLGSNNNANADHILVTVNAQTYGGPIGPMDEVVMATERRLSQQSEHEVEVAVASRRNSGSSSGYHRRVSPQMSLTVPPQPLPLASPSSSGILLQSSPLASHLAPPSDEELLAQRRFSEVNAAIERHNSRRQAKRSQSVMYRPQRRAARRRSTEIDVADVRVWNRAKASSQLQATLSAPPLPQQQTMPLSPMMHMP